MLFKPLGEPQIEKIVELQFNELRKRLAERLIAIELTPAGRKVIAHEGYDPVYGARPLRRFIQRWRPSSDAPCCAAMSRKAPPSKSTPSTANC
ncbi:hypothetical protein SANTM175S_04427 [Streptomyces antimycoticus]